MHTESEINIQADARTAYELAADVERWPEILPHYRWVRVLSRADDHIKVHMAARRGIMPVSWRAEQRRFPDAPRITFRHVAGITRGMEVEWTFTPVQDGVRVSIRHSLELRWPLIGELVAGRIIAPFFIAGIAGRTLGRIKALAEEKASAERIAQPR